MQTSVDHRRPLYFTLIAAFVYCLWLGWHWLPLGYSDKELAAFVSRVWDVQRELREHGQLPWWTPYYMSGSSYGLNHSQGFYLLPWLVLATFTTLPIAGKLVTLAAIFSSAVAMYFCVRHFLRTDWGAALAAMVFMLHPQQLMRGLQSEHMGIIVFMPFMPLSFWLFARALQTGKFRDSLWCALSFVGLLWTHNKMAFVHFVFVFCYLVYWFWRAQRTQWLSAVRTCGLVGAASVALGAFIVMPGLIESKHAKLLSGEREQLVQWQRGFAFKSLLSLVDRDGIITRQAADGVLATVQARGGVRSQEELARVQRIVVDMRADAPEKYMGLVLMAIVAVTALCNSRRENRGVFWLFVGLFLLGVMLASGQSTVGAANWLTWRALFSTDGVPSATRAAVLLALGVLLIFLVFFYRRKLTTTRKRVIAAGALVAFLLVPAFKLLALVPFFKEIRAPFVFYDGPVTFIVSILAGFFVTDVLSAERWRTQVPKIVAGLCALMLLDFWPYQKPAKDNGVPERTLQNLQSAYTQLREDPDWVKTLSISGRYFHLLGPMYGGKPQMNEAFYNWMSPLGTALLNQQVVGQLPNRRILLNRVLLDLMAVRYVVFDLGSAGVPDPQSVLDDLGQNYQLISATEDFAVFRNNTARPYVTAYERACAFTGDYRRSAPLAVALAANNWPLVHTDAPEPGKFVMVYHDDVEPIALSTRGQPVTLSDLKLSRPSNGEIRLSFTTPRASWLVIAESYYPFWRAELNGKDAEVLRVNCGLMGLEVPAGTHEIVLRYVPPRAYAVAAGVSLLTMVGCLGATIWGARRGRP